MPTIKPVGDRVLIQYPLQKEEKRGGIWIPQNSSEKPQVAEVIGVGHGAKGKKGELLPFEVKGGDQILVNRYAGAEVTVGNDRFSIINENDIIGVIE